MESPHLHDEARFVLLDGHILPTGRELHLNKRLDALVPHKSDAVGQFIEDRVLHAREHADGTPEPSVWPTRRVHNRASGLQREGRGSVDDEPGAVSFGAGRRRA
jgi:hypothetical protein